MALCGLGYRTVSPKFHKSYVLHSVPFVCFNVPPLLLDCAVSPQSVHPLLSTESFGSSPLVAPAPCPALAVSFQLLDLALVSPSLEMRKHFDCCENHWIKKALPSSVTHPFPPSKRSPSAYLHPVSSQCSVSCGQGVQQRHVGCQIGTHKTARESECSSYSRPESERVCQASPCPLYTWRAEQWQQVSRAMK